MGIFNKRLSTKYNTILKKGSEPFFKSVDINGVDILRTEFSYLNQQFTGLFQPAYKNSSSNDIANFRNPTMELIDSTNFTDLEIYSLGIVNTDSQFLTGDITPTGDINTDVVFNIDCSEVCSISIISGILPPGLELNDFGNNSAIISGNINSIDITLSYYDFIIRALTPSGNKIDRYFRFIVDPDLIGINWNAGWLSSLLSSTGIYDNNGTKVYPIVYDANTITNVYSLLEIDNPYNLDVTYELVPNEFSSSKLLPDGVYIEDGILTGVPNINNSLNTYYYFSIKASITLNGVEISGKDGVDTSDTIFYLYLNSNVSSESTVSSSNIVWISNSALGSVNEQSPITFSVSAESTDGSTVTYTLYNSTLSDGLNLSSDGYLYGITPFTNGKNITYSFTVKASTKYSYSTKTFSFTVIGLNQSNDLYTISLPLFNREKTLISKMLFNPVNVPEESIYRLNIDTSFGRQRNPAINIATSLNRVDYSVLMDNLYEYYRPLNLRFGNLGYSKVYDPSGNYIYDVVYINIIDTNDNGDAFDSSGNEQIYYANQNSLKNGCVRWNIPVPSELNGQYYKTRMFPSNLFNFRMNLIQTTGRQGYQNNYATDENQVPTGTTRGIGINGTENIPQWMMSAFGGWAEAVALVFLNTGYGEQVLNNLQSDTYTSDLIGSQIRVDRFMVSEYSYISTMFDVKGTDYTELGDLTSFDSCASQNTENECTKLYPSILSWTQFDFTTEVQSSYIKFPPGDLY